MKIYTKVLLGALVAMIPAVAHAGPGAIIYGCIYLPTAPISALAVNFTTVANHCMNSTGSNTVMNIPAGATGAGVQCTSIGYVEATASTIPFSDTCGSDDSLWTLSYNITNTGYSGSAQTNWPKNFMGIGHNSLSLQNQSANTLICSSANLCGTSTSITWNAGAQGPLYIIFQPQSQ